MKYLPIGSVVSIGHGEQPLMIYGRKQINEIEDTEWDYLGCLYPEGNLNEDYTVFFNNTDITKLYFVGFETKIDQELQKILNDIN